MERFSKLSCHASSKEFVAHHKLVRCQFSILYKTESEIKNCSVPFNLHLEKLFELNIMGSLDSFSHEDDGHGNVTLLSCLVHSFSRKLSRLLHMYLAQFV